MEPLDETQIREHWESWAAEHGTSVRATTMTQTAKTLEIHALYRHIRWICLQDYNIERVLEVGCGNGVNRIELAKRFPDLFFYGVDYVPEMIKAAKEKAMPIDMAHRVRFAEGDLLNLHEVIKLDQQYDVVLTDRCLINFGSWSRQLQGLEILASKVRTDGYLILIENTTSARQQQNDCREIVGLSERKQPPFNLFLEESKLATVTPKFGLELLEIDDFSALHDFLLYVLIPMTNGGKIDYDHPLVQAATDFSVKSLTSVVRTMGQNRLFLYKKRG